MADGVLEDEIGFDYVSTVKMLLGIGDNTKDAHIEMIISMVKSSILNYCNITELPSALNYTLCSMVADFYRDNILQNEGHGTVNSISEGGRTVSFGDTKTYKDSIEDRVSKTKELNRYKKLFRL